MELFHRRVTRGSLVSATVHLLAFVALLIWQLPGARRPPIQLVVTSPDSTPQPLVLEFPTIDLVEPVSEPPAGVPAMPMIPHPSRAMIGDDVGVGQHHGSGVGRGKGTEATFFGSTAQGNHFVYIVDASTSMSEGNGRRFDRALNELLRSINGLRNEQFFYVFLFSSTTRRVFDEAVAPHWLPATDENKQRLREWLDTVEPSGGTRPQEALYLAAQLQPSAVFLLSDGDFSQSERRYRGTMMGKSPLQIVKGSSLGNIPIHTIALEDRAGQHKLLGLSSQTGGDYQYVQNPVDLYREEYREIGEALERLEETSLVRKQEQSALERLRNGDTAFLHRHIDWANWIYMKIEQAYPTTRAAVVAKRRRAEISEYAELWLISDADLMPPAAAVTSSTDPFGNW